MRLLIAIIGVLCIVFTSCTRHLSKTSKETKDYVELKQSNIDSSKVEAKHIEETQYVFGDTLNGSVAIQDIDSIQEDSLESNGIKIHLKTRRTKFGYRQNIQAIAKPASKITTNTLMVNSQNRINLQKDSFSIKEKKQNGKKSKVSVSNPIWWILLLILLLAFVAYKTRKYWLI